IEPRNAHVVEHHRDDRDGAETVDIWSVDHGCTGGKSGTAGPVLATSSGMTNLAARLDARAGYPLPLRAAELRDSLPATLAAYARRSLRAPGARPWIAS